MLSYEERRERQRRFFRRNFSWMIPLGMLAGAGLFIGLGFLVVWLWRETLVDIFAIRPISFWQAWGLIVLSQILFKANMQPMTRTGRWRHRASACGETTEAAPQSPPREERT